MSAIGLEAEAFFSSREKRERLARARAALQLACGVDLDATLASPPETRKKVADMVRRRLARERLKGLARHWSYDINRHIAMKLALDALVQSGLTAGKHPKAKRGDKSGRLEDLAQLKQTS